MAARSFSIEFSERKVNDMYRLAENVAKYPNRIHRARAIAAEKTKADFKAKLIRNYSKGRPKAYMYADDRVIPVEVTHGRNRSTINIKILKAKVTSGNKIDEKDKVNKARMDVNIRMYGRKRYSAKARNGSVYDLSQNSHPSARNYPQLLRSFKVPAKSRDNTFYNFIKYEPMKLMRKNLREQLAKEGFGVRGGVSGIRGDITADQATSSTSKYIKDGMR